MLKLWYITENSPKNGRNKPQSHVVLAEGRQKKVLSIDSHVLDILVSIMYSDFSQEFSIVKIGAEYHANR